MPRVFHPPKLQPGRVYRTDELRRFSKNPTRLAERLVADGEIEKLGHGLYYKPRMDSLGKAPPADDEILRAFLKGTRYVFSGPAIWNAFRLGTTGLFAHSLVYNGLRTGLLDVGGRKFLFRRVRFPKKPTPEWYVVDMLNNSRVLDAAIDEMMPKLKKRFATKRLDLKRFRDAARRYASRSTKKLLRGQGLVEEVANA
jgi:hypothetical protein